MEIGIPGGSSPSLASIRGDFINRSAVHDIAPRLYLTLDPGSFFLQANLYIGIRILIHYRSAASTHVSINASFHASLYCVARLPAKFNRIRKVGFNPCATRLNRYRRQEEFIIHVKRTDPIRVQGLFVYIQVDHIIVRLLHRNLHSSRSLSLHIGLQKPGAELVLRLNSFQSRFPCIQIQPHFAVKAGTSAGDNGLSFVILGGNNDRIIYRLVLRIPYRHLQLSAVRGNETNQ